MANVATVEDVSTFTGVSVDRKLIAQAQTMIELFSGKNLADLAKMQPRDQRHVKLAVAYQAVWMDAHPEVFTTMDVQAVNQDDLVVRFRDDSEAHLIAPLAKAALKRLSWKKRGAASISLTSTLGKGEGYREHWKPLR
jgi:hypothetical protein